MKITGKVSTFGGKDDTGVGAKEGLALFEKPDEVALIKAGLLMDDGNPSRFGLARRLNPAARYIACRWDYSQFPKEELRKLRCKVTNVATGESFSDVRPVDWGPNEDTGRAMDLSPGLARELGLNTDDIAEMEISAQVIDVPPASEPAPKPPTKAPVYPNQSEAEHYFGKIETANGRPTDRWETRNLTILTLPFQMRLSWAPSTVIRKITCHRNVRGSLGQILDAILAHYGSQEAVKAARMDLYGGCYNFRLVRGGSTLSQHAYGAAIDIDPDRNPLGKPWEEGMMPMAVIEIFESFGWTHGARWKGRPDCMHAQQLRA